MEGRLPIRRDMIGPNLVWRFLRIGSISENDLRSHVKEPIIGKIRGPGGSFFVEFLLKKRRLMNALSKAVMAKERTIMYQVSIAKIVVF